MPLSFDMERLSRKIREEEGFVKHVYKDTLGYDTLGYGFLVDKRGGSIPREVADFWLAYEIKTRSNALQAALPWITRLDPVRQEALIAMVYQMGLQGLLGFKNTLRSIEIGAYEAAAKQMLASKWAEQTPARAKRVAEMIRTGRA